MTLFKLPAPPADLVCTPEAHALAARDNLLSLATKIQAVRTPAENQCCAAVGSEMQKLVKGVEATRKDLTAPYLAAQRAIKDTSDAFCEPITTELTRLGMLAAAYRQEQERKAAAERRARAEEITKLQEQERRAAEAARQAAEKGDIMAEFVADIGLQALSDLTTAAIAKPEPEAQKTAGQSFTSSDLRWECTDPIALWVAAPELCNAPTPKASAIKSMCCPEIPVPGLRLWWESSVHFKSR